MVNVTGLEDISQRQGRDTSLENKSKDTERDLSSKDRRRFGGWSKIYLSSWGSGMETKKTKTQPDGGMIFVFPDRSSKNESPTQGLEVRRGGTGCRSGLLKSRVGRRWYSGRRVPGQISPCPGSPGPNNTGVIGNGEEKALCLAAVQRPLCFWACLAVKVCSCAAFGHILCAGGLMQSRGTAGTNSRARDHGPFHDSFGL
jgi:hypothetical protein